MNLSVKWFRHSHENRNDLLRFGLMRLHYAGQLRYTEVPFADAKAAGFSKTVMNYPDHRHLSFIQVESGSNKVRCLVDNEDSFVLVTPLVAEVDLCFCAGYNADLFERKRFVQSYTWQTEHDLKGYRKLIEEKIENFGDHFFKVRRFVPIGPNQGAPQPSAGCNQKFKNLEHRLRKITGKGTNFSEVYKAFERRQAYLTSLRDEQLNYDVVLNDSLWGWPQHRINLHRKLQELSKKNYSIHSVLNWNPPVALDGSDRLSINSSAFPVKTKRFDKPYEQMLAQSRLAVFACGFHWGWRNIMMLALQAGIPVLTDRLLTEPYFDMNEFRLFQQEDHDWETIEPLLKRIDKVQWWEWKKHNQAVYDRYMSPESVAKYFIDTVQQDCPPTYTPNEFGKTRLFQ